MAIAVEQFFTELSQKPVRSNNMFEMFITTGYNDIDTVFKNITMYGQGFELPTRTVNFASVSFKGYEVGNAVATNMAMGGEHNITVNADINGELRRAFLAWQGKTMNPAISEGSVFEGDRRLNNSSVVRIHLLGNDFKSISEIVKLINVKVQEVGSLSLSNVGGEVATFQVTLKSSYWEIETANDGAFKEQK